ncbi:hypothetical protein AGLY_004969 [Aphis glycines]|uniref:Reverse transcriptase domain-containing protein n=1 Tax=Aphis glycines TaxID=307491 RepID=A0A6G0TWA5_APHGL|nr:hypothetical protein AGLY_004969 [Aphis glycines]
MSLSITEEISKLIYLKDAIYYKSINVTHIFCYIITLIKSFILHFIDLKCSSDIIIFHNSLICRILLFADDAKLFTRISTINDCYVLQASLDGFIIWWKSVGLSLNEDKCKVMSFYRSRAFIDKRYTINRLPLKWVNDHTTELNSAPCLVILYCSFVRLILNYGSIAWIPFLWVEIKLIQRVQSRYLGFAGFLLKSRRARANQQFLYNLLHGRSTLVYVYRKFIPHHKSHFSSPLQGCTTEMGLFPPILLTYKSKNQNVQINPTSRVVSILRSPKIPSSKVDSLSTAI